MCENDITGHMKDYVAEETAELVTNINVLAEIEMFQQKKKD